MTGPVSAGRGLAQGPQQATTASGTGPLLQRKCACGNHSSGGECDSCKRNRLQRKPLAIGVADDPLEAEADRAADAVLAGQAAAQPRSGPLKLSRASGAASVGTSSVPASVHETLGSPGQRFGGPARSIMEAGYGYDFSAVRIHADDRAARSAADVGALAYTVGKDIVFGAGQYAPHTAAGRHLLAHELAHVVQQDFGSIRTKLARQVKPEGDAAAAATCPKNHHLGEAVKTSGKVDDRTVVYYIWGTWKQGDTPRGFCQRTFSDWIRWRFKGISAEQSARVFEYMMDNMSGDSPGTADCQIDIYVDFKAMSDIRRLSGEIAREKEEAKKKADDKKQQDQPGPAPGAEDSAGGSPKEAKESGQGGGGVKGQTEKPGGGKPGIGDFGPLSDQVAEDQALDQFPTTRIKSDNAVLKDPARAELYLKILEQYTKRSINGDDHKAAGDGLDDAEIEKIVDGKPMRKALTAVFSQAYREFEAAGGSDLDKFSILIQLICEQFTRGNPTATHNQMLIGKGVPEKDILGIVERGSGILLYNDLGVPLPGIGGVGFRDKGYSAARKEDQWGFNLANVSDPGLRALLNSLRQTFGDPTRMAIGGAEVYFNNIELVNGKVRAGLPEAVKQKFLDMLPFFIGFIGGHAVSTFLMRVPNPQVAAVGLTLKGLLTAAGYIMEIDFAAGALDRLLQAAAHLSHFERNDKNEVTALSEAHLNAAAKIIQDMVAEIAAMFATMALGKLIGAAQKGIDRFKVECTHCDLKGPGAEEAKAPAETKAEPAKENASGKEKPPQEAARERLDKLNQERSAKQKELDSLRQKRESLRQEYNKAIEAKNEAVKEWDKASDQKAVAEARQKARAAKARADAAAELMDELPSEEGSNNDLKDLDSRIEVENIKANPQSRAALPCFAAETLVLTPQGPRPISLLRPGDLVWSHDFASGATQARPVLQCHRSRTRGFHRLTTRRGQVRATSQHRFWSSSDGAWKLAQDVAPGQFLFDLSGEVVEVVANSAEAAQDADTFNLSVDEFHTYFVGPGLLVHNDAVDVGLGGGYLIYRATNARFPTKVYIGQTTELDAGGKSRGAEARQGEHQEGARKKLELDAKDIEKLSEGDKDFYEFMKDAQLEPIVKGIANKDQADYLEQRNIDMERKASGPDNVMNRRNQITGDEHMKEVVDRIKADPAVKAKGYCP